jgi:hypothetical protein
MHHGSAYIPECVVLANEGTAGIEAGFAVLVLAAGTEKIRNGVAQRRLNRPGCVTELLLRLFYR